MSSRKEQKEKLRQERLQREQEAKAAQRRKQLVGYGVGGALALAAVVIVAVLLLSGGGGSGAEAPGGGDLYPSGVAVPEPTELSVDVEAAAKAANCELSTSKVDSRDHISDPNETVTYPENPPAGGRHFEVPAEDGRYDEAPDKEDLVHTLEHGRVIIWFKPTLPEKARGELSTLFDEDPYQLVLTPNDTGMTPQVAATTWSKDPEPLGSGQTLACPQWSDKVIDALRAFRDEHRGNGPEAVP